MGRGSPGRTMGSTGPTHDRTRRCYGTFASRRRSRRCRHSSRAASYITGQGCRSMAGARPHGAGGRSTALSSSQSEKTGGLIASAREGPRGWLREMQESAGPLHARASSRHGGHSQHAPRTRCGSTAPAPCGAGSSPEHKPVGQDARHEGPNPLQRTPPPIDRLCDTAAPRRSPMPTPARPRPQAWKPGRRQFTPVAFAGQLYLTDVPVICPAQCSSKRVAVASSPGEHQATDLVTKNRSQLGTTGRYERNRKGTCGDCAPIYRPRHISSAVLPGRFGGFERLG